MKHIQSVIEWMGDRITPVEVDVPSSVWGVKKRVEELIEEVNEQLETPYPFPYSIAGGCLSNTYINHVHGTNHPLRDIDVFIQAPIDQMSEVDRETFERVFSSQVQRLEREETNGYEFIQLPILYRMNQGDIEVDLVFCHDLKRIFDFDLTFRHFYLFGETVYAHKRAIEDVHAKRISLMSPVSPVSTFTRFLHFEETLGFEVEMKSFQLITWILTKQQYQTERLVEFTNKQKKLSNKTKRWIEHWAKKNQNVLPTAVHHTGYVHDAKAVFPYDQTLGITYLQEATNIFRNIDEHVTFGLFGKCDNDILTYQHRVAPFDQFVSASYQHVEPYLERIRDLYLQYIRQHRLEWVTYKQNQLDLDLVEQCYEDLQQATKQELFQLLYAHRKEGKEVIYDEILQIIAKNAYDPPMSKHNASLFDRAYHQLTPMKFTNKVAEEEGVYRMLPRHGLLNDNELFVMCQHQHRQWVFVVDLKNGEASPRMIHSLGANSSYVSMSSLTEMVKKIVENEWAAPLI